MEIFATVISGVVIFVLGKLVEQFIINPLLDFRRSLGDLSYFMLTNQGVILEGRRPDAAWEENSFRKYSAILMSKHKAIALFDLWARVGAVPDTRSVYKACEILELLKDNNTVSSGLGFDTGDEDGADPRIEHARSYLEELGKLLNIATIFRSAFESKTIR